MSSGVKLAFLRIGALKRASSECSASTMDDFECLLDGQLVVQEVEPLRVGQRRKSFGAEAQSSGSASTSAVSPAAKKRKEADKVKVCIAYSCEDLCIGGRRWCSFHNRLWEGKKAFEVSQVPRDAASQKLARDDFNEKFQDEDVAASAIQEWAQNNTAVKRYQKKNTPQSATWADVFSQRTEKQRFGDKLPFEKEQFTIWRMSKVGRSRQEAQEEWVDHESNAAEEDKDHRATRASCDCG